jgi:hypothetical protein
MFERNRSKAVELLAMIDRAIAAGASGSYALMDSWFTHAPLIQNFESRTTHYWYGGIL